MTRGGRKKDRDAGPERRCIVSGDSGPASGLIRFVLGPDGVLAPDIAGKLPGRGIWVTATPAALEQAVRKRLFTRAARAPVTVPDGLVATIEAQLARRVIDLISLARRGGAAVAGYEKVRDRLLRDEVAVLVQAADGSPRGRTKLRPPEGGAHITCLTGQELGMAFGREHVINAALSAGGLASRVVDEAARLASMRGRIGEMDAGKD
ncbi:MAG: RNA-binding protein [Pararhodobacter sp.]|nr:RNA-binding protein [Pararhodobacter sp.]